MMPLTKYSDEDQGLFPSVAFDCLIQDIVAKVGKLARWLLLVALKLKGQHA